MAAMMTGIDSPAKVERLLAGMQEALPLPCAMTQHLAEELRRRSPGLGLQTRCLVTWVSYSGDEGGIVCRLDLGDRQPEKEAFVVSLTHLVFTGGGALVRDITAYTKHRIKRLRRLEKRRFAAGFEW